MIVDGIIIKSKGLSFLPATLGNLYIPFPIEVRPVPKTYFKGYTGSMSGGLYLCLKLAEYFGLNVCILLNLDTDDYDSDSIRTRIHEAFFATMCQVKAYGYVCHQTVSPFIFTQLKPQSKAILF